VRSAAREAGRDPDALEITASIVVSVDEDARVARDVVRSQVALYLAEFPNVARESGVPEEQQRRIAAVRDREGSDAAATLVGDEIVDALTCSGTLATIREALERRREAGVQLPIVRFAESGMASRLADLVSAIPHP
jgi:alkanesulfonate monooxygenase SsuD/methylene tetrahydromethanopterin reductase-like flavin-dependent oxidoreductase (luciferase family)